MKGAASAPGIYAALLDPRIETVVSDESPKSYLSLTEEKIHDDISGIVIPGVLRDFDLPGLVQILGPRFQVSPTAMTEPRPLLPESLRKRN